MASLFKRSNGVFYIAYVQNGIRHWKSTGKTRHTDALKVLAQFDGSTPIPTPQRLTLKDFAQDIFGSRPSKFGTEDLCNIRAIAETSSIYNWQQGLG